MAAGLARSYASVAGEEGFPGTLQVAVTYRLNDNNELVIEYQARHRSGNGYQPYQPCVLQFEGPDPRCPRHELQIMFGSLYGLG